MHKKYLSVALVASLGCLLPEPCHSMPGMRMSKDYYEHLKAMMRLVVEADNQLYKYMEMVANGMENFYAKKGHFPEPGLEQDRLRRALAKVATNNPYNPKIYNADTNEQLSKGEPIKIVFLVDGALSEEFVQDAQKTAPKSWTTDPGTIVVITNGVDRFVVWGASADRLPIKQIGTGSTRVVFREVLPTQPQLSTGGLPH